MRNRTEAAALAEIAAKFQEENGPGIVILSIDRKASYLKLADLGKLGLDQAGEEKVRKLIANAQRLSGSYTLKTGSHFQNIAPNPSAATYLIGNTKSAIR